MHGVDIYYIEDFFLTFGSGKFSYSNKRLDLAILVIIFFYKITLAIVLCFTIYPLLYKTTVSYSIILLYRYTTVYIYIYILYILVV